MSPMSIQSLTTMVMFGATGSTKNEMKTALYCNNMTDTDIQNNIGVLVDTSRKSKEVKVGEQLASGLELHRFELFLINFFHSKQDLLCK